MAWDSARDFGLKPRTTSKDWWVEGRAPELSDDQYATTVICEEICSGSPDEVSEHPYLDPRSWDEKMVAPPKGVLRTALAQALDEFYVELAND